MTFDPSADFVSVCDGLEAVTLHHRRGESETIANALHREVTTREAIASNGKYTTADTRFHFPVSSVDSMPMLGDRIEDASGEYYTILEVQSATLGKRYKCVCRNLAIVNGLDSIITIEKAAYAKGTQGAIERTWKTWRKTRARIQPIESTRDKEAGAQRTIKRYSIVLDTNEPIDNSCRFLDAEGHLYRFEKSTGSEEIGGLQTVEVSGWRT
jgi:head-tail adaptor